jgi:hypothetical protein
MIATLLQIILLFSYPMLCLYRARCTCLDQVRMCEESHMDCPDAGQVLIEFSVSK